MFEEMTWEILLFLAAAIHGILLSVFFILKAENRQKIFLGIYLLNFSITMLHYVNYWTRAFNPPGAVMWVLIISSWLMPLALLYMLKKHTPLAHLKYHLIVPLIFTSYWIATLFIQATPAYYQVAGHVLWAVKTLFFISYGVFVFMTRDLGKWERLFFWPYGAFILGMIGYKITIMTGVYTLRLDYIICAAFVLLTYSITYIGEFNLFKTDKQPPKYASSGMTEEEGRELLRQLDHLLREEQCFRDPTLGLTQLSGKLEVPKYKISQALGMFSQRSFNELVNEHRIADAQFKLQSPEYQHYKLEAIGAEVGFKNKVSFYQNFNRIVGMSPGAYRQKQLDKVS